MYIKKQTNKALVYENYELPKKVAIFTQFIQHSGYRTIKRRAKYNQKIDKFQNMMLLASESFPVTTKNYSYIPFFPVTQDYVAKSLISYSP